ncbi:MAG: TolC family protein [Bacteroidaceae bacterium]|nr:TolC family protein [Bacteroidaceae bacterium]
MKRVKTLTIMLLAALNIVANNNVMQLTLEETILLARTQSLDAAVALDELRSAYWEYRIYRAGLLPEVNFSATAPSYSKSYNSYQNSDGTYTFVRNNYMQMNGRLSVNQSIWLTGGTLSLNSSLDYLKTLSGDRQRRYMSTPIALTLNQPIFGVNNAKWNRRIEPIRYAEAKANFLTATEQVTMSAINYFFTLLLAKENVSIARQNLSNAEKLYEVALSKHRMGIISDNDLLQLRLNTLNARSSLTNNESNLKSAMFSLRSFLTIDEKMEIIPMQPDTLAPIDLIYDEVLQKAMENNSISKNLERRRLQADYNVAGARGNLRQINLTAQVGLSGVDRDIEPAYDRLNDNQYVQVGLQIPLLDWGKRRGRLRMAESNREITISRIEQEMRNFKQNLFILVEQFNNQRTQLEIAQEADTIARRRYKSNVETFMIGKISTLDLNDAQVSKDQARRNHISELMYYWYYYYKIRSITLWDWEHNTNIDADFEKIVNKK